ncbi:MAG: hypothetical protein DI622_01510 [Chryseobacterium sp.]|uniref:hypothetical protein n=1 Tax=Chryseobacterium sp. TaxID=1871047 RepID=UPI000DB18615|nr:hypothetical protein [Chryseobacterium sp.]MPS64240.1 hypothetical protein [Chryseobacterium sp.]PZU26130.1 MAG: hypothetical protein DI622_01510 [Chryseobacterium sp.]
MKIELILEEKVLLLTSYIRLINTKNKITIKKDDIKFANVEFSSILNKDVTIRIIFKTFKRVYVFSLSDIIIKTNEIILLGTLNDPLGLYDQGYVNNFKLLSDKKEKIEWYELNEKQKYYYLRGSALLYGVRKDIDNSNSTIVIDFLNVKSDLDVYYEIGKSFFKSYGYFGTEFHSFRDCLANIHESIKKRKKIPIIKIKGYRNFKKNFEKNILFEDFYNEFKNNGFEVMNDE